MTIKLLAYYGHFPVNSLVTLDAATEAALIATHQATASLAGGTVYMPPGNSPGTPAPFPARAIAQVVYDGEGRLSSYMADNIAYSVTYPSATTILHSGGGLTRTVILDGSGRIISLAVS